MRSRRTRRPAQWRTPPPKSRERANAVHEDTMVHKANQIALFFAAYPHDEAVDGILDHLKRFWEPRMRRQISDYVANDGANLHALVLEAVARLDAPVAG
jgi:formate dehydrogenase subunit delta